jgi:hypothetical protein
MATMKLGNPSLCRRCLMVYTTLVVAISCVYLFTNWGVHSAYVAVREEMLEHAAGEGDLEGAAFTESGGAEYLLVLLYFVFHVAVLGLLLLGRRRNIVMGVACALLLACSMMYILFYGCMMLQAKMEQHHSLNSPGYVPLRKPEKQAPYKLTAQDVDRTIASGNAGAEAVVDKAPPRQNAGTCGGGAASYNEPLSYPNLAWTVLETLVDVLAAIVAGPEEAEGDGPNGQRYHPDGLPISPVPPFASVRRGSLLVMSVVGLVLSLWGVMTFDLSPEGVARASNPGLTASALSQLPSLAAAKSKEQRRRERAASALQDTPSASNTAVKEAKKNQ